FRPPGTFPLFASGWSHSCSAGKNVRRSLPDICLRRRDVQHADGRLQTHFQTKAEPMISALGQKQTCASQKAMSALPPVATAKANSRKSRVRFTLESGHGPLLETTRGLDRVVIGAIAVARERP